MNSLKRAAVRGRPPPKCCASTCGTTSQGTGQSYSASCSPRSRRRTGSHRGAARPTAAMHRKDLQLAAETSREHDQKSKEDRRQPGTGTKASGSKRHAELRIRLLTTNGDVHHFVRCRLLGGRQGAPGVGPDELTGSC